ncbi:MAG: hypothetical protein ACYC2H_01210 [Thermoplasmatota archaeon]
MSFHGAKALESCRTYLSRMSGRDLNRVSDADVFEFLARCWKDGPDAAFLDLKERGHVA